MKTVILAGGGSGGHVTPALSIFRELRLRKQRQEDIKIVYIGRSRGIERNIFEQQVDVYHSIVTEKWRRHLSLRNLFTIFVVIRSVFQCIKIIYPYRKASILFHTGGYVSLPPSLAAWLLRVPVCLHEQTSRAGLANRISAIYAKKIFISFTSSRSFFSKRKTVWSGYPISNFFYSSSRAQRQGELGGESYLERVSSKKPLLLITGGGNGSRFINERVLNDLSELTRRYFVLHQVGREHLDKIMEHTSSSYLPIGLVSPAEWVYLMRQAVMVVARGGAGTVAECVYLNKKVIFIPLEIAQGKEQVYNTREAQQYIHCRVVMEKEAMGLPLSQLINDFISARPVHEASKSYSGGRKSLKSSEMQWARRDFCRKLSTAAAFIVREMFVYLDEKNGGEEKARSGGLRNERRGGDGGDFSKYRGRSPEKEKEGSGQKRGYRGQGRRFSTDRQRGGSDFSGDTRPSRTQASSAHSPNRHAPSSGKPSRSSSDKMKYVDNPFKSSR